MNCNVCETRLTTRIWLTGVYLACQTFPTMKSKKIVFFKGGILTNTPDLFTFWVRLHQMRTNDLFLPLMVGAQ